MLVNLSKEKHRMRKIILYGGFVSGGGPRGGMNFVSVTIPCLFYSLFMETIFLEMFLLWFFYLQLFSVLQVKRCPNAITFASNYCSVNDGFPQVTFHFENSLSLRVRPHEYLFPYVSMFLHELVLTQWKSSVFFFA